jgi:hypothetical protein
MSFYKATAFTREQFLANLKPMAPSEPANLKTFASDGIPGQHGNAGVSPAPGAIHNTGQTKIPRAAYEELKRNAPYLANDYRPDDLPDTGNVLNAPEVESREVKSLLAGRKGKADFNKMFHETLYGAGSYSEPVPRSQTEADMNKAIEDREYFQAAENAKSRISLEESERLGKPWWLQQLDKFKGNREKAIEASSRLFK